MINIIEKPLLTEKAMKRTTDGQYVFQVNPNANKIEIKRAIEDMFEVKVKNVKTLRQKPKYSQRYTRKGIMRSRTKLTKKAYITLLPGFTIELISGLGSEE